MKQFTLIPHNHFGEEMKHVVSILLLTLALSMLIIGCAGPKQASTTTGPATDETIKNIPEWALNIPQDPNFIFEVGTATSRDMQLARDKAGDAARMNIAKSLETHFQGLSKRFQEEVGTAENSQYLDQFTQATKAVVSTVLTGVYTEKTKVLNEGGVFRSYVLLKLSIGASSQALMNKIKQQEEMYTRFRASETFKELEKQTEDFEKFKQGQ